ncbi:MAG: hypothetical protein JWN04_6307, partial [Myxococcaceae bacterium]|nr:hypothetical protein [Myxococcaceae bacterium]
DGARQRPPDADITGGYQLPLRLVVSENGTVDDISFDRQRVRCSLASAPAADAREYDMRYKINQNPSIDSIELAGVSGAADGSARYQVARGTQIPLLIRWSAAAQESYVLFDPIERAIVERTETLDVSWYTNGGEFSRDRTTQDPAQPSSSNTLELDSDSTQPLMVWVVLRDERGGVGIGQLTLDPI